MRWCSDKLELGVVLLEVILLHVVVELDVADSGAHGLGGKRGSVGHLNVLILRVVVVRVRRVGVVIILVLLLDNLIGPLDSSFLLGVGSSDGLVEPAFLFALSVGKLKHQRVEKIGVADEKAEVVIGLGSLSRELSPSLVGEVVSLCDRHVLLECGLSERRSLGGSWPLNGRSGCGCCGHVERSQGSSARYMYIDGLMDVVSQGNDPDCGRLVLAAGGVR